MKRSTSLIVVLFIALCAAHANAAPLPERVRAAAQARVDAGQYPALVIAYVDGTQSKVDAFGKLDDGRAPDADTVFEIAGENQQLKPYLHVRGRLEALVSRPVMYDLVELGEEIEIDGRLMFAVRSGGELFPVMPADELERLSR